MKKPGKAKKKRPHRGSKRCHLSQTEGRKLAEKMHARAADRRLKNAEH